MTEKQLKYIKGRLKEFYLVVKPICDHWENGQKHLATLSVLLQNIQFDGSDCDGYSHEKAVDDLKKQQLLIYGVCEYINSHLENWIKDEIDCIINFESLHFDEE